MRALNSFQSVHLHIDPIDGRKQINGLASVASFILGTKPAEACLFAFINKAHDTIRLLYWDRTGFALWIKRLEKDKFRWPERSETKVTEIGSKQLAWLLEGLDIRRLQPHKEVIFSSIN